MSPFNSPFRFLYNKLTNTSRSHLLSSDVTAPLEECFFPLKTGAQQSSTEGYLHPPRCTTPPVPSCIWLQFPPTGFQVRIFWEAFVWLLIRSFLDSSHILHWRVPSHFWDAHDQQQISKHDIWTHISVTPVDPAIQGLFKSAYFSLHH